MHQWIQLIKIAIIIAIARQHLLLAVQQQTHTAQLADHEQRLEKIEATLGDSGRFVTPDQAMGIIRMIRTLATEIEKHTKKNEYLAIHGQLHREFGIASYKQFPANRFNQAMKWLTDRYRRITGQYPQALYNNRGPVKGFHQIEPVNDHNQYRTLSKQKGWTLRPPHNLCRTALTL